MNQHEYKAYLKAKFKLSEETYTRLRGVYRGMSLRCKDSTRASYYGLPATLSHEDFFKLWVRDEGWKQKHPSIDRIDSSKGYIEDNCRFIELKENCRLATEGTTKEYLDRIRKKSTEKTRKPVNQLDLNGNTINTFPSTQEAKRQTGAVHVSAVCLGKRKTSGGFKWQFV